MLFKCNIYMYKRLVSMVPKTVFSCCNYEYFVVNYNLVSTQC